MASFKFIRFIGYLQNRNVNLSAESLRSLEQLFEQELAKPSLPKPQDIMNQLENLGLSQDQAKLLIPEIIKPAVNNRLALLDIQAIAAGLADTYFLKDRLAREEWDMFKSVLFDGLSQALVQIVQQPDMDSASKVKFLESELRQELRSVGKSFLIKELDQKFDLHGFAAAVHDALYRSSQPMDSVKPKA